ncbi:hypothetical protein GCM10027275_10080 [Rhabdobacter roseus]
MAWLMNSSPNATRSFAVWGELDQFRRASYHINYRERLFPANVPLLYLLWALVELGFDLFDPIGIALNRD